MHMLLKYRQMQKPYTFNLMLLNLIKKICKLYIQKVLTHFIYLVSYYKKLVNISWTLSTTAIFEHSAWHGY